MLLEALLEGLFSGAKAANQAFGISTQWIMNFQRDYPVEEACSILRQAQPYKDDIIGIGLDNPEIHDFPGKFAPLFQYAKEQGYRLTSHCDVHQPNSIGHIRDCIGSIGRINTLLSLFQHVKKENNCVFRLQNLTDIRRHPLNCFLQTTDPVNFQPPGVPAPCRYFDSQQFGELTESNCSQRLSKQICLGRRPAFG